MKTQTNINKDIDSWLVDMDYFTGYDIACACLVLGLTVLVIDVAIVAFRWWL